MQRGLTEMDENTDILERDTAKKEVGDRVKVIDFSSMTHLEEALEFDDYDEIEPVDYFIVIATHEKSEYKSFVLTYTQDLIIVNPVSNKQYRIISGHTKLK